MMQATRMIIQKIRERSKQSGENIYISNPVLRIEDGAVRIAVFLIDYRKGEGSRPQVYLTAGIDNGENLKAYNCQQKDFTSLPFDRAYDRTPPEGVEPSEEFLDKIYGWLDGIRQSLIEGMAAEECAERYDRYMQTMEASVPHAYRPFYDALSRLTETEEDGHAAETPKKLFSISEIRWNPVKNLSGVPEMVYRMAEQIAEYIHFLDADAPVIYYEYPGFCMEEDSKMTCSPWQELLVNLKNGPVKTKHYKTTPKKKSVYTMCADGQKGTCLFARCPYFIAAYIRYLKDYYPEELKKQREEYRKNRFAVDAKELSRFRFHLRIPKVLDKEKLEAGLGLLDAGVFANAQEEDGPVHISWVEDLGPKGAQIQERTVKTSELNSRAPEAVRDVDDKPLGERFVYMLYAYSLIASGKWEEVMGGQETKPEPRPEETKEKPSMAPVKQTAGLMDRSSLAYRCASAPDCSSFYGVYQYTNRNDTAVVNELMTLLKRRGAVKEWKKYQMEKLPEEFEAGVLSIVTDIGSENVPALLSRFMPGCFVLLCGSREETDLLLSDPVIRAIYGKCMIRGVRPDPEATYARLKEILPENMKKQMEGVNMKQFANWLRSKPMPANVENAGDYIAWQCALEKRLIFLPGKERR